jgi:SAGA-associated factor 73
MLNTKQHESAADAALAAEEGVDGVILNEDEEFEQVMAGVLRAYPVPLERKVIMPTQTKSCFFRMREMLIGSLSKVPPLPATLPPSASPDASHSVNAVMLGTGAVLGRTIVFDTLTGAQYARPPRVYVSPAAAAAVATARQQTAMAHATSPQLVQQAVLNQQRVRQVQAQQQHQQLQSAAAGGLRSTPG